MKRTDTLKQYGLFLFAAYLALFAVMHYPIPFGGDGILALQPHRYLTLMQALDPFPPVYPWSIDLQRPRFQYGLLVALAVIALGYVALLRKLQRNPEQGITLGQILGGALLFSVPLLLQPYLLSTDIHIYVFYGRISAIHHANPVFTPPSAFPNDPFFASVYPFYRDTPSVYGPIWMLLAHNLTLLAEALGGAQWVYLLLYKVSTFAFHLASVVLLWQIVGRWRPEQRGWATLAFAWSPLALIESMGSAHNDSIMIFLILLGIWLAQSGRWRVATLALVSATLVKWIAIVVLPLYAIYVIRQHRGWRQQGIVAAQLGVLGIGTAVASYIPSGGVGAAITALLAMPGNNFFANSLSGLFINTTMWLLSLAGFAPQTVEMVRGVVTQIVQWDGRLLCVVSMLGAMALMWFRPSLRAVVQSSCVVMLIVLCTTGWFWPWYLTWPLALAPMLAWKPIGRFVVYISVVVLVVYVQVYALSISNLLWLALALCAAALAWWQRQAIKRFLEELFVASVTVPDYTPQRVPQRVGDTIARAGSDQVR